jgi:hypothetical protein
MKALHMAKAHKGFYRPKFPKKYKGDPTRIIYRSSWELKFMVWCDHRTDILEWSSEEFSIPYKHPIDGRYHRYFPDFKIKLKNKHGIIETIVIEIKPLYQTKEPIPKTKINKRYLTEVKTYLVNKNKWAFAEEWCKDRNYRFAVFTEKELGIKL